MIWKEAYARRWRGPNVYIGESWPIRLYVDKAELRRGMRVIVTDDVIIKGLTANAASDLCKKARAELKGFIFGVATKSGFEGFGVARGLCDRCALRDRPLIT